MAEMNKDSVAEILTDIATMLELKGENVFKIRAYQNAARAMETFAGNLAQAVGEGKLAEVPGIGKARMGSDHRSASFKRGTPLVEIKNRA